MLRDLSLAHILILLAVIALVFGARRLPEIGASLGKGIREFRKSLKEIGSTNDESTTLPSGESAVRDVTPERRTQAAQ